MSPSADTPHPTVNHLAGGLRPRGQRGPRSRACAECKRHKIRCDVRHGETACVRCLRTGIECSPYDPTQKFLDDNEAWKTQTSSQIGQLQSAVDALLQRAQLPDLTTYDDSSHRRQPSSTSPADSALGNVSATESVIAPYDVREHSVERQSDDPGLVQAPMSNLYELTGTSKAAGSVILAKNSRDNYMDSDLIARGVLTVAQGERLTARFIRDHNPLLWGGVIFPYTTLDEMRRASVLLSTCIFTIASLHSPGGGAGDGSGDVVQKCYDFFVSLARSSSLSRANNIDDVRALCLAAFYFPNLSWRLSGQAVRMAAEMNVHQSFQKLMNGDMRQAERVRLWYALFVCDRHFSIAYGRPFAMLDDAATRGVERFIESPAAVQGDVRVSAQVALFKILAEAHLEYGTDQNEPLTDRDLERLRMFNISIEQWRLLWQPRSLDLAGIGSYPSQGVVLYYHFSRFQLNSLALRGVRWPSNEPLCLSRREAAMAAISAAMSTLVHVLDERDIRRSLTGVPLFVHTMVAFCATFLLKIAAIWTRGGDNLSQALGLGFNLGEIVSLTRRSADMLSEVASQVSEKHITNLIVKGIHEMLQRVAAVPGAMSEATTAAAPAVSGAGAGVGGGGATAANGPTLQPPAPMDNNGVAAADFASVQLGGDNADNLIYNMDLHSLAGLLEYGSDLYVDSFAGNDFGSSWTPSG